MIRKTNHIPTYNICNLNGQQDTVKDITVYDLQYFLGIRIWFSLTGIRFISCYIFRPVRGAMSLILSSTM